MKVEVKLNQVSIYSQVLDDETLVNKLTRHLLTLPSKPDGSVYSTTLTNGAGHPTVFNTLTLDLPSVIRMANGWRPLVSKG